MTLGTPNAPGPMTYTPEQLDMLRHHFERSGAPTNRIGLDHWLATQVPPGLRRSIMAQLFPEPISLKLEYAQDLVNAGFEPEYVRRSLHAWRVAPAEVETLLAAALAAKKPYNFSCLRRGYGLTVDQEHELLTREEREQKTRAARTSWARARQLEAA